MAVRVVVSIFALAAVSFGVAFAWQRMQEANALIIGESIPPPASRKEPVVVEASPDSPEEQSASSAIPQSQGSAVSQSPSSPGSGAAEAGGNAEAGETDAAYAREAIAGSVPKSGEAVEYDYFEDAIFFGDSISTGIPLYMKTMVPDAAVVATQGINTMNVNTLPCIDINGSKMTMLDAAKTKGARKKVYIMLGSNGLDLDEKSFIDGYAQFVGSVKAMYPDAVIYVQSMMPVTMNVREVYDSENINNGRIEAYNTAVSKMALDLGVNYLDVAQCVVDESGALPAEASPFDGMHLTPEYYIKWFDYLRAHTVEPKTK